MVEKRKPGRPLGSKSKPKVQLEKKKNGSVVMNIKMEKQLEGMPVNRDSNQGWIRWGLKNDYPAKLSELYYNSVTHKSCIDFAVAAVLGEGIDYDKMEMKDVDLTPNYEDTWEDIIQWLAMDYAMYGAFALQIIKNNDGQTYSFFHQPFSQVRSGKRNEDGVIENYYICSDWTQTGLYVPVELESFSFTDEEDIKSGRAYLYVYQTYSPMIDYYPVPHYISALKSIQSEVELQRYDLRSITNNFSASGILTLGRVDDEDEKAMIIEGITAMYSGSDNANSLIVNFRNNDEEKPAEFVKIDKDSNGTVDLFEKTNDRLIQKICAAHKITSKGLIGYDLEGASLGGDGNQLNVAYNLYMKTFGEKMRRKIVNSINNAFKMNGIETEIILKPLKFNIVEVTSSDNDNADVVDKNEDTEQATSENENKNLTNE